MLGLRKFGSPGVLGATEATKPRSFGATDTLGASEVSEVSEALEASKPRKSRRSRNLRNLVALEASEPPALLSKSLHSLDNKSLSLVHHMCYIQCTVGGS